MKKFLITLIILFIYIHWANAAISGYKTVKIAGFTVHISDEALSHKKEIGVGLALMKNRLTLISRMKISDETKTKLKSVPIFVEWNLGNAGAMYHPSKDWLLSHGYIPEKEKSVEITNLKNFIDWTKLNQPHILTHELSHAYMDKFLTKEEQESIKSVYQQALSDKLYDSVEYTPGGNMIKIKREAYAKTNELEYFAEISEAYLGKNDFYPYTRKELEVYDPNGYTLMKSIWK